MSIKWICGRQDWKTFARGQENCYLMTNGLGGYSSLTMTGSAARGDHAFLMACLKAPNNRWNMIHRLAETLEYPETRVILSSQDFADGSREEGYRYQTEFSYEDTPVWRFLVNGVEIEKEAGLRQQENTIALRYRVRNRSKKDVCFVVTPFYRFSPKGEEREPDRNFSFIRESRFLGRITESDLSLYCITDGADREIPQEEEVCYYAYDACDGRPGTGRAYACHRIGLQVPAGCEKTLSVLFTMDEKYAGMLHNAGKDGNISVRALAEKVIEEVKAQRMELEKHARLRDETAQTLVKSAHQFIALRASTGGKTILAGFPFFEDWGRDTMIALPGVCLSTRRYADAASILRTFAQYERDGLMPNLFPEGKNDPMYNTADAALLFINCVWLYWQATEDADFVREMLPVMKRIIASYEKGTAYNIHMDSDGLIIAGSGLDQVTWMDVRVGDILPTPRHGKPVEINAYWYNALRIMSESAKIAEMDGEAYETLSDRVRTSFIREFWMEEKHCLRDVISGTAADNQIRCNQIWALSLPFTMLEKDMERQIMDTVFGKLYTPYGLRTLDPADPEFRPEYGGEVLKRDLAYHQGTVWVYPLGEYYLAYLRINGYSEDAKRYVRAQMEVLQSALREGCIGQLPEIYDGLEPVSSKGCFAQAWSVGEMLRVYEALER